MSYKLLIQYFLNNELILVCNVGIVMTGSIKTIRERSGSGVEC